MIFEDCHPDTKEMNVWHFEMLNASGHVQYVVENISGCLGCMGVDRWPCQVLCHRSVRSDRGCILYTRFTWIASA